MATTVLTQPRAPETAPNCYRCGGKGALRVTWSSNGKGNACYPYYLCSLCDGFLVFKNLHINNPRNSQCCCDAPNKMQISGPEKRASQEFHYVR